MRAKDFEFRNRYLSDIGFMICSFSGERGDISNGSEITFNQISMNNGEYWLNAGANYESVITTTFSICKDPCKFFDIKPITIDESTSIMRWLNSKRMYDIRFLDDEYENVTFKGSFTQIQRVEYNGALYGFTLTFTTNRPFGLQTVVSKQLDLSDGQVQVINRSDEEGDVDVKLVVTLKEDGDFTLTNNHFVLNNHGDYENETVSEEEYKTTVKNCKANEVLTFEYPLLESSLTTHTTLPSDFNYNFPKLFSFADKRDNTLSSNLKCSMVLSYHPVRKVGV